MIALLLVEDVIALIKGAGTLYILIGLFVFVVVLKDRSVLTVVVVVIVIVVKEGCVCGVRGVVVNLSMVVNVDTLDEFDVFVKSVGVGRLKVRGYVEERCIKTVVLDGLIDFLFVLII